METIGYVAATLTVVGYMPQVFQAVKTRKTRDLSLATFGILILSAILWSAYGFGIHKPAIYLPNILIGIMAASIAAVKISDRD